MSGLLKKYKIVMLGDAGVGKTQLVYRILDEEGEPFVSPTIGVQFNSKPLFDKKAQLNFWDTGGQEKYRSVVKVHYRSADAFVFVYDVCNQESFKSIEKWLAEANEYVQPGQKVKVLCGNKIDLQSERRVTQKEGRQFAAQNEMEWVETSATKNINVTKLVETLVFKLNQRRHSEQQERWSMKLETDIGQKKQLPASGKSCCC